MIDRQALDVQVDFLLRNGSSAADELAALDGKDPSRIQIAGFAKVLETSYNFFEGCVRAFGGEETKKLSGESSHKELLDWATSATFGGMPLLPEGIPYQRWLAFRHKMKYQSIDLILWEMIRESVMNLQTYTEVLAEHFLKVADSIERTSELPMGSDAVVDGE